MKYVRFTLLLLLSACFLTSEALAQIEIVNPSLKQINLIKHQHGQAPDKILFLRYKGTEEFCANVSFVGGDTDLLSFPRVNNEWVWQRALCFEPGELRTVVVQAQIRDVGVYASSLHLENQRDATDVLDIPIYMKYRKLPSVSIDSFEVTNGECGLEYQCWKATVKVRNRGFRSTRRGGKLRVGWVFGEDAVQEKVKVLPIMRQKRARTFTMLFKLPIETYSDYREKVYSVRLVASLVGDRKQLGRYKRFRSSSVTLERYV